MTTSGERVLYEVSKGIARLTINRPEKLNALDCQTIAEIDRAVARAGNDQEAGVLLVTGMGDKAFVAGADIKELRSRAPPMRRPARPPSADLKHSTSRALPSSTGTPSAEVWNSRSPAP
jgi:enoyl-CoA hydratase/carnithine racemase